MNKTLIAAAVAGIVLLASNAQAQTVPEGYQLQQVLMMSDGNSRVILHPRQRCYAFHVTMLNNGGLIVPLYLVVGGIDCLLDITRRHRALFQ